MIKNAKNIIFIIENNNKTASAQLWSLYKFHFFVHAQVCYVILPIIIKLIINVIMIINIIIMLLLIIYYVSVYSENRDLYKP